MSAYIDLLPLAKANGERRVVRGLRTFVGSIEPEAATRSRRALVSRGMVISVETTGRDLSYDERARLLDFAAAHLESAT